MYAEGDVVRITVVQEYDVQQCLNVFYYQIGALGGSTLTPAEVGAIFWDKVKVNWKGSVSNNVRFDRIIVENLDGDLSYGEYVLPDGGEFGGQAGQSMAAFCAFGIQLNRTNRLVRNGSKRIVGVVEATVDNFGVLTAGQLEGIQDMADDFASDLMVGLAVLAAPVIVGFPNEDRVSRVEVDIDTATAKTVMTSQNTRKRGAGS